MAADAHAVAAPAALAAAREGGAVVVDLRSAEERSANPCVDGAVHVEFNKDTGLTDEQMVRRARGPEGTANDAGLTNRNPLAEQATLPPADTYILH